jgi:hypothetical protein
MKKIVFAIVVILAARGAAACECIFSDLDSDSARAAGTVFVFRLVSAELRDKEANDKGAKEVVGTIRVVDNLRSSTKANAMVYYTSWCCGTRVDIGKFYVAFLKKDAREFQAHSGSILELGETYSAQDRENLLTILNGKRKLEDIFSELQRERIHQVPRPTVPVKVKDK